MTNETATTPAQATAPSASRPIASALEVPLTPGTTLVEASAGSGKTYLLIQLTLRLLAEPGGIPPEKLLLLSFSRAAVRELRDRLRQAIRENIDHLQHGTAPPTNPLPQKWIDHPQDQGGREALQRLKHAAAIFDLIPIRTLDSFAHSVLHQYPLLCGVSPQIECIGESEALFQQTEDDVKTQLWSKLTPEERQQISNATKLRLVLEQNTLPLRCSREDEASQARLTYANKLRQAYQRQKQRQQSTQGSLTFDELTQQIASTLEPLIIAKADAQKTAPWAPGALGRAYTLRAKLQAQYQAVLIDEFQDTNETQWHVFHCLFGAGTLAHPEPSPTQRHQLYLIGDPKQAIYGFRGGNINVYRYVSQRVVRQERILHLDKNWRSDAALLEPLNALFEPITAQPAEPHQDTFFGDGIPYHQAQAARSFQGAALRFSQVPTAQASSIRASSTQVASIRAERQSAPLQLRYLDGHSLGGKTAFQSNKSSLEKRLPQRIAADLHQLLRIEKPLLHQADNPPRPLNAGDIAILVRTNAQAEALAQALRAVGIPFVIARRDSVLASHEARELKLWLEALLHPHKKALYSLSATDLIGFDQHQFHDEACQRQLRQQVLEWSATWKTQGILAAFRQLMETHQVPTRLAPLNDGERRIVNLLHLSEWLHHLASEGHREREALYQRFVHPAANQGSATPQDLEREDAAEILQLRPLLGDANAVQIATMHASKGLEYPIVFMPYSWEGKQKPKPGTILSYASEADPLQRVIDVSLGPTMQDHVAHQQAQEEARLLYVGLTRAKHQVVLYTGPIGQNWRNAPLTRLFLHWGRAHDLPLPQKADDAAAYRHILDAFAGAFDSTEDPSPVTLEHLGTLERLGETTHTSHIATPSLARSPDAERQPPAERPAKRPAEPSTGRSLRAAVLRRPLRAIPQHSFSSLTRTQHERTAAAEDPEDQARGADHDALTETTEPTETTSLPEGASPASEPFPRAALAEATPRWPRGANWGSFLHTVLEKDLRDYRWLQQPSDPRRQKSLRNALDRALARHTFKLKPPEQATAPSAAEDLTGAMLLEQLLIPALHYPLPALDGFHLAQLAPQDSLREMNFCLPCPTLHEGCASSSGQTLSRALEPSPRQDVLEETFFRRLRQISPQTLSGFLVGSIDLVFRRKDAKLGERWYLADFKSSCLPPPDAARTLQAEMTHWLYPLQYHLYLVALHRYLRLRLKNYRYEKHFGGVYYLFLPAMAARRQHAVFHDKPPLQVVENLDRLFAAPRTVLPRAG